MQCSKRKKCNICDGTFEQSRGCLLEKRCPACRILHPQGLTTLKSQHEELPISNDLIYSYYKNDKEREKAKEEEINTILSIDKIVYKQITGIYVDNNASLPEDNAFYEERKELLEKALGFLTEKEKIAVREIIMNEETHDYVAEKLNVTRERARQLAHSGIKKLKHPKVWRYVLKEKCLSTYLLYNRI